MCNHYRNNPEMIPSWRKYIGAEAGGQFSEVKIDVWPKYAAPVVRADNGGLVMENMTWGFPWLRKGKKPGSFVKENTTNVRNLDSGLWRNIVNHAYHRCLVPFSSFAEPKPNAGREEVWFTIASQPVAAFAGIWRVSDDAMRGKVFAFLTCAPNPLVEAYHPKAMPVILLPDDYGRWLAGDNASDLATPFPSQLMTMDG